VIAILEDDPGRIEAMRECLRRCGAGLQVISFDNAPDMIEWLRGQAKAISLICLDHDLGPNRIRNGEAFDPGTGRDVVDYLATRTPICPVLIHTTNSLAVPGMAMMLDDSGWVHSRVIPHDDLEWIGEDWMPAVKEALSTGR
jgi:hypothetical protein